MSLGIKYAQQNQHEQAVEYAQQALEKYKAFYKGNHPDILNSLITAAVLNNATGQHKQAIEYLEQALVMKQALQQDNHSVFAQDLNRLESQYVLVAQIIAKALDEIGATYLPTGQTQESLKYFEKALVIKQQLYKGNHPDIVLSLIFVGLNHLVDEQTGQIKKALECLEQALVMKQ